MGFLQGRVTYLRFRVDGPRPGLFSQDHLDSLEQFQAGRQRIASADGIECGWTASDHVLDTDFTLEKNIVNDALSFDLRVDADKIPGDLMKAYCQSDLKALAANNPSGFPTAKQKREAKESARDRLETEANDGRFKKRKCIPVLWDSTTNELLFGATSLTHVDRLVSLFQQTFGYGLDSVTASNAVKMSGMSDALPCGFAPGASEEVAWIADETSRAFLGNEFILWLWYLESKVSDTVTVGDGSEVTFMLARKLSLECPRGETGADAFSHEGPTRLPEAMRAIQSGKLPRKTGLTLVHRNEQYEFLLHVESLAVAGAKLPKPPDDVTAARAKLEHRIDAVRGLIEAIDSLYAAFITIRLGPKWGDELARMQAWLKEGK